MKTSKLLAICSIFSSFFSPFAGAMLSYGGLSIKEDNDEYKKLNIFALIFSLISLILHFYFFVRR